MVGAVSIGTDKIDSYIYYKGVNFPAFFDFINMTHHRAEHFFYQPMFPHQRPNWFHKLSPFTVSFILYSTNSVNSQK
jgi:hypothetical protein